MHISDIVGPQQCSSCGQYDCKCPGIGDRPSKPGPGRWDENDWVCPGGTNCDCEPK